MATVSYKKAGKKLPKTYKGKSTKLGYGGRSAMMHDAIRKDNPGMPESEINAIVGKQARKMQAAPGQKNYHGKR